MKTMKCIHHTDLDGLCSAAIVNLVYPNIQNIPMDYDYPQPKVNENDIVIMVDFHLQPFSRMCAMKDKVKQLVWIDHHRRAMKEAAETNCTFTGLRREGTAACELAWEYFMHSPVPEVVKLLGAYDVHNLSNEVLLFQYGMRSYPATNFKPDNQMWKVLLTTADPESTMEAIDTIEKRGAPVLTHVDNTYKDYFIKNGFPLRFKGYNAIAVNIGSASSRLFDCVKNIDNFDILITFVLNRNTEWVVSLYAQDLNIDVSAIACEYGGGGHKGAAGFTVKKLPFSIN